MAWDQVMGKWTQMKGLAKETWGRLTDNDWEVIEGKRDQLLGKIREVYGVAKEEAERQVNKFEKAAGSAFKTAARVTGLAKPAKKHGASRRTPKSRVRTVSAKGPERFKKKRVSKR